MKSKKNKNNSVKLFDNNSDQSGFSINYCVFDDDRRVIVIDNNKTDNYCYYEPSIPEINQKEYMVISGKGPFEFELPSGSGPNDWPRSSQEEFLSGITLNGNDIQTSFDVFNSTILFPFLDSGINFFSLDDDNKEMIDATYIGDLSNNGVLATKYGTVIWQVTGGEIHRVSFANSNESSYVASRLNIDNNITYSVKTFFSEIVEMEFALSMYNVYEPKWTKHSAELPILSSMDGSETSTDNSNGGGADDIQDKMIDFEKFVPVEVCKTISSNLVRCTSINHVDESIEIDKCTVIDIGDVNNSVDGSIFKNHAISSTGKVSKSLPIGKMKSMILDARYLLSMKLSRYVNEINLSNHVFFITMNKINLSDGDDTVIRIGNSKRINFDKTHPASEQYRIRFSNSADAQVSGDTFIDDNFLYSLMLDTSKGRDFFSSILAKSFEKGKKNSNNGDNNYMTEFLANASLFKNNDEHDDDLDGGSDIERNSELEGETPTLFSGKFKLITVESQIEVSSICKLDNSIINISDILSPDEMDEIVYITTDKLRLEYLQSCLYNKNKNINNQESIYILSEIWWEELGFTADLAICYEKDRDSIDGHSKPILLIQVLEDITLDLFKNNSIYTGNVAVMKSENNDKDVDDKSLDNSSSLSLYSLFNIDRTDNDIHKFNNDSNRYMNEFLSMDSAISGDTEKLIGGSFSLKSGYHDGKESDKMNSNVTICRLYKSVTVALFESNPSSDNSSSYGRKELRANFLDLCDRIDDSKIAFINSFFFSGSNRVRSVAHPDDVVGSEYDKAIQHGTISDGDDEVSKNATYSVINKFLPYITDFINATSGIHPRFNFNNLSLMTGSEYGHIGEGFHYFLFASMRTVLFFNAHEKIDPSCVMNNFFIISNITEDFFFSKVLNDNNKLLDKVSNSEMSNHSPTSSLKFRHVRDELGFDDLEPSRYDASNKRIRLLRSSDNRPMFSRSSNSSVPTVNTNETSNLLLGHNTLIFCGVIENELYMIADTRTTSGHFINTDFNTDKIQSITTGTGDTFSFGCAGLVSDIQFCSRIFRDITNEMGKDWSFNLFIDTVCDFLFSSYRSDQGFAVSIIVACNGSIVELSSDGAQLDYSKSSFQAIGSGMMFVLPALNSLYSTNGNRVDFKSVIDIFTIAAKYDAGISTTYVMNKIGSSSKRIISFTDDKLSTVDV